jgi:hypothetical protein
LTEETFKTVFKDSPLKEPSLRALEGMSILLSKESDKPISLLPFCSIEQLIMITVNRKFC